MVSETIACTCVIGSALSPDDTSREIGDSVIEAVIEDSEIGSVDTEDDDEENAQSKNRITIRNTNIISQTKAPVCV